MFRNLVLGAAAAALFSTPAIGQYYGYGFFPYGYVPYSNPYPVFGPPVAYTVYAYGYPYYRYRFDRCSRYYGYYYSWGYRHYCHRHHRYFRYRRDFDWDDD
jgi:hypothetical protein